MATPTCTLAWYWMAPELIRTQFYDEKVTPQPSRTVRDRQYPRLRTVSTRFYDEKVSTNAFQPTQRAESIRGGRAGLSLAVFLMSEVPL